MIRMNKIYIFSLTVLAAAMTTLSLDTTYDHTLTDDEYRMSVGNGYIFFEVLEPEQLSFTYKTNPASFSPPWNETMTRVPLIPTDPPCGCGFIRNHDDVEGKIAFMERGDCSFVSKVVRAEQAGAIGAIITDQDQENDEMYISMVDDTTERSVGIPAVFLLGKNGHMMKRTLEMLGIPSAIINIPVNISAVQIHKLNQPPWLVLFSS